MSPQLTYVENVLNYRSHQDAEYRDMQQLTWLASRSLLRFYIWCITPGTFLEEIRPSVLVAIASCGSANSCTNGYAVVVCIVNGMHVELLVLTARKEDGRQLLQLSLFRTVARSVRNGWLCSSTIHNRLHRMYHRMMTMISCILGIRRLGLSGSTNSNAQLSMACMALQLSELLASRGTANCDASLFEISTRQRRATSFSNLFATQNRIVAYE